MELGATAPRAVAVIEVVVRVRHFYLAAKVLGKVEAKHTTSGPSGLGIQLEIVMVLVIVHVRPARAPKTPRYHTLMGSSTGAMSAARADPAARLSDAAATADKSIRAYLDPRTRNKTLSGREPRAKRARQPR